MAADPAKARAAMVSDQLAARGISDERVLEAMGTVPREEFVRPADRGMAYADRALGIEAGQTISQPWIVAAICQGMELAEGEKVLEVGTGSGYSAAVLERLCDRVVSVERIEELADTARQALARVGAGGVEVRVGDGSLGAPDEAPFDAIAVHAALPGPPRTLLEQLVEGGRLVAPIDTGMDEVLTRFRREGGDGDEPRHAREPLASCRFVPLIGEEGYRER